MSELSAGVRIVDATTLSQGHRALLRPGEVVRSPGREAHRLPRFFFEVDSSAAAVEMPLTPHFSLWEFMEVDLHEAPLLRRYPRYVPCAVTLLAAALEVIRLELGASMRIAANGGYRSPSHARTVPGSPHCWGTAVNIYRIGGELLDTEERIHRYAAVAARAVSACWPRPFGSEPGQADDHLHVDIGFVSLVPHGYSEET